ncbi:MAG: SH3 domain-containing protein, partial [Pseudomonadota bacterium]
WASLRYSETNMRVGPSREYPVEWVYQRKGLPVKVLRTRDEWWLVTDVEGTKGWISRSQLTPARSVVVTGDAAIALRKVPDETGEELWQAEPGVIGKLVACEADWCEIDVAGRSGWVEAGRLWGDEDLSPAS